MNRDELIANVDTIVVVMMENRSFDHVLGWMRHPSEGNRADVDGIEDLANPAYANPNGDGEGVQPFWTSDGPLPGDVPHDAEPVQTQLAKSLLGGKYLMNGFVRAYELAQKTSMDRPAPMGLLRARDLPTTSALARQYTVCDRWFSCIPTSTAPNRLLSMCGTTEMRDTKVLLPDQPTVYDWLLARGVRWRVYSAGLPFFMLMPRLAPLLLTSHFRHTGELAKDLATDAPDAWPQVIFVEPDYHDAPIHLETPCDNHAPLAMAPGEAFLAKIYRALTSDPKRWARTVFLVTYDEHGGFFDHVPPEPIAYTSPAGFSFATTGPRVPVVVGGPFATRGGVSHALLDNTSILQLLAERFGAPGEAFNDVVADRARRGVASVSTVLSTTAENTEIATLGDASAPASTALDASPSPLRTAFDGAARAFLGAHQAEALLKYPALAALRG